MFNAAFFATLKRDAVFINTSRGGAVDEAALKARLASDNGLDAVLDVWQHEPDIDLELMAKTIIATPHIAGYSREGKYRGLQMVYRAACEYFGLEPQWSMQQVLPELQQTIAVPKQARTQQALHALVRRVYDIWRDDSALRKIAALAEMERGPYFDSLRKHYPERREFFNYRIEGSDLNPDLLHQAAELGFTMRAAVMA
jgi:erythronate-4-phosphate dehydrogenase